MRSFSSALASTVGELSTALFVVSSLFALPGASAISFTPVPSPNLRLSDLGRVSFAGDFDAISLFEWEQQFTSANLTQGSQALLTRLPNDAFLPLYGADGSIQAMCPFVANGTFQGVMVGGNFTSLGGAEVQGVALYKPGSSKPVALPGLTGRVNALYCDAQASKVYVGGVFNAANSTNAVVWTTDWTNMPFAGFNGPVTSITKTSSGNIVFGGSFDGLGNATSPVERDSQVVPLSSANITSGNPNLSLSGFSDPRNILCKSGQDGSGNAFLVADNQPGWWQAKLSFGFRPSKIRIYNTKQDGRGTRTWRFTATPINGIMNLTYTTSTGEQAYCDATCPLPEGNSSAQDFYFVNSVGMNGFRIDMLSFYGSGGGLAGIELFQNGTTNFYYAPTSSSYVKQTKVINRSRKLTILDSETYSFAINDFNEPSCDATIGSNSATATGSWTVTPSGNSNSDYLTAVLNGEEIKPDAAQVVFKPNIKQSGNYSVTLYTPGCIQDGTCLTRGRVNITGVMGASGTNGSPQPISTEIFQTNNFDKYDQIYFGYVDASSGSFRPTVTLSPSSGQAGPLNVVAQRVRFELLSPNSGGLQGLFEYNPSQATIDTNFDKSVVDRTGKSLGTDATVETLTTDGNTTYVAGNFSTTNFSNIFALDSQGASSLPNGGLNSGVWTTHFQDGLLYAGGNFSNTRDNTNSDLQGVAAYSTKDKAWRALGAGVNGAVAHIVPFSLNLTANKPETVIAISGLFDRVLGFGSNDTFSAGGIAIWVPSRSNWLHNLGTSSISMQGSLTAFTEVPNDAPLFAGSMSSQALSASGAVGLMDSTPLALQQLPVNLKAEQKSTSTKKKRAIDTNGTNVTGIVTGKFYHENGLNLTILGGHFSASASDGANVTNLIFVNNTDSTPRVTGLGDEQLDRDSAFLALGTQGTTLWAGGIVSGRVNGNNVSGIVAYDLVKNTLSSTQAPAIAGNNVAVNAIAAQSTTGDVYVGGRFESAGSLSCPGICIYSTSSEQWVSPGSDLSGVVTTLMWASTTQLMIGGNLTASGNKTTLVLYDTQKKTFSGVPGAGDLPGPITALCLANQEGTQHWAAGKSANGTSYLERYDGSKWETVPTEFGPSTSILGLQTFTLDKNHDKSGLIEDDRALLILGKLDLPNYGNTSAVLYNGTGFTPFLISTSGQGSGAVFEAFVENPDNFFKRNNKRLAVGFVVLIGLGIALGLTFLLVVAGIVAERLRRKREGYVPANTQMFDRGANIDRIPPEHLFGTIGQAHRNGPL